MTTAVLICDVLAFVFELLATASVPNPPYLNMMAAGLMFYFLGLLIPGLVHN